MKDVFEKDVQQLDPPAGVGTPMSVVGAEPRVAERDFEQHEAADTGSHVELSDGSSPVSKARDLLS